jgi:hypothetical protein
MGKFHWEPNYKDEIILAPEDIEPEENVKLGSIGMRHDKCGREEEDGAWCSCGNSWPCYTNLLP